MKNKLESLVEFYKSISTLTRLKILDILLNEKECMCICELSKKLNKHSSVIYKHILILEKQNLIKTCKQKNYLFCCVKNRKLCKKIFSFK